MERRVFEFASNDVPVTVAGLEFTLNASSDTGDYLKEVGAELKKLAAEMTAGTKTKEDVVAYGMEVIDKLLGTGTAERLLSDRTDRLSDIMDLCMFLTETVTLFRRERMYRAQRRAAGKK